MSRFLRKHDPQRQQRLINQYQHRTLTSVQIADAISEMSSAGINADRIGIALGIDPDDVVSELYAAKDRR